MKASSLLFTLRRACTITVVLQKPTCNKMSFPMICVHLPLSAARKMNSESFFLRAIWVLLRVICLHPSRSRMYLVIPSSMYWVHLACCRPSTQSLDLPRCPDSWIGRLARAVPDASSSACFDERRCAGGGKYMRAPTATSR